MKEQPQRVELSDVKGMFGESATGKRERDEDYIACGQFGNLRVGVLCDGMGGGRDGDLASEAVARAFITGLRNLESEISDKWLDEEIRFAAISEVIGHCHEVVNSMAGGSGLSGTTLTAVVSTYEGGSISLIDLIHIGDSRCYRICEGSPYLLTNDHSVTGDMVRADYIKIHEIEETSGKNTLTRNIGDEVSSAAEITSLDPEEGVCFLLCCDGVWGPLHGSSGLWLPESEPCSQESARIIVEKSIERGSTDNCSVLMVDLSA